jgi:predicted ATPase
MSRRIGRYEILAELGARTLDAVLHGPAGFRKQVVLRLLSPGQHIQQVMNRHPNVLETYGVVTAGDLRYAAVERVADGSVAEQLPLSTRAAVQVGIQLCRGLMFLIEAGGTLPSLAPTELLLDSGVVKLPGIASDGQPVATELACIRSLGVSLSQLGAAAVEEVAEACAAERPPGLRTLVTRLAALEPGGAPLKGAATPEKSDHSGHRRRRRLIGRRALIAEIENAVATHRLVTLRGPAGVGKTALAGQLSLATGRLEVTLDGGDPARAVTSALGTLDARDPAGAAEQGLAQHVPLVLVLDGADQTLDIVAGLVTRWLGAVPRLHIVVTSRTVLGIGDEHVVPVSRLNAADAVELLVTRSKRADVELHAHAELSELAQALDGLPLALELAAARLDVMTPRQVLDRLTRRFALLRGSGRTLQGALDVSWDLLDPDQRAALAQLSVFADRFDVEAAIAVLDLPEGAALDALDGLERQSLVEVPRSGWLRLSRSIQAYAAAKLPNPSEVEARHGALYAERVRTGQRRVDGRRHASELRPFLAELIVAAERALERSDLDVATQAATGAALVLQVVGPAARGVTLLAAAHAVAPRTAELDLALFRAMFQSGRRADATSMAQQLLASAGTDSETAAAHRALAAALQGVDGVDSAHHMNLALEAYRRAGDRAGEAVSLANLAHRIHHLGRADEAEAMFHEAMVHQRQGGSPGAEAMLLGNLASMLAYQDRFEEAEAHFTTAIALLQQVGDDRTAAVFLGNLGTIYARPGRLDKAREYYRAALVIHERVGNFGTAATVHGNLGRAFHREGRLHEARASYDRALELARQARSPVTQGSMLAQLAQLHADGGRLADARTGFTEALAVCRAAKSVVYIAVSLIGLARVERADGREASAALLEALEAARSVRQAHLTSLALADLAAIALDDDDPQPALDYTVEALGLAVEPALAALARARNGAALALLGRTAEALVQLTSALEASTPQSDSWILAAGARVRHLVDLPPTWQQDGSAHAGSPAGRALRRARARY